MIKVELAIPTPKIFNDRYEARLIIRNYDVDILKKGWLYTIEGKKYGNVPIMHIITLSDGRIGISKRFKRLFDAETYKYIRGLIVASKKRIIIGKKANKLINEEIFYTFRVCVRKIEINKVLRST